MGMSLEVSVMLQILAAHIVSESMPFGALVSKATNEYACPSSRALLQGARSSERRPRRVPPSLGVFCYENGPNIRVWNKELCFPRHGQGPCRSVVAAPRLIQNGVTGAGWG